MVDTGVIDALEAAAIRSQPVELACDDAAPTSLANAA